MDCAQHSIANMRSLPFAILIKRGLRGVLVGLTYWYIYLRKRGTQ